MPLYEYRCKQCGHQFEKIQSFSAPDEKDCPVCKGELERLISAPAIQFKGAGWYVNDYAAKGGSRPPVNGAEPSTSSEKPKAAPVSSSESGSASTPGSTSAANSGSTSGSGSGSSTGSTASSASSKSE
ncbi:MAG TPA: zinc ribbon domain-containing protein [Silvibacterium sp.]|nr:zinc ribbon domain-containing protein [Silvibacterium sp.]